MVVRSGQQGMVVLAGQLDGLVERDLGWRSELRPNAAQQNSARQPRRICSSEISQFYP